MIKINKKTRYSSILAIILVLTILGVGGVSASLGDNFKSGECMQIVTNLNATSVNISVLTSPPPNPQILLRNVVMEKAETSFNYTFCQTSKLGKYTYGYCTDTGDCYSNDFSVKNTSMFFIILIYCLGIIFLICTLFVNEEFFVYISGLLFLIGGIYIMINGLDILSDLYSRSIAYISIGIGFLFTIGAYIYNSYTKSSEEEEIEEE